MKKIFLTLTLVLFIIPIGISQDLPSYVPTDGLVAYYPFNGNANDASGNGNHGTVNGATLTPDRNDVQNSSYGFDGLDDYISINSNNNQLDFFGNCCITISAWIKLDNNDNQYGILTNSDYNNIHQQYALKVDSNSKLYFLAGDKLFESNGINYSSSNINNGQWTHTLVSYDGNKLKLYLNGNLDYENQIIDNFPESPSSVAFIGNSWGANNDFFPGQIDEVGIWNRALTEKEIQNLYTSSTGDIKLNGVVSAENNQIRNVADPTHLQDVTTKKYVDSKTSEISNSQNFSNNSQIGLTGVVYDFEGNRYETVIMCDGKQWTTQYLNVSHFANGEQISEVTDNEAWRDLTTPAWCYSYNQDNGRGKIYNGFALTDERGLAPEGWHIATEEEWNDLIECLGGTEIAGGKLKISGTQYWTSPNVGSGATGKASNSSGMSLLPDGFREGANGNFYFENEFVSIWNHSNIPDRRPYVQLLNDKAEILKGLTDPYDGAHILLVKN